MKQNVMCISARRDITSVVVYEVLITEENKLEKINVIWHDGLIGYGLEGIAKRAVEISKEHKVSSCLIECINYGMTIKDYLKENKEFAPIICKACCFPQEMYTSEAIYKTSKYIQDEIISINTTSIKTDLYNYKFELYGTNGKPKLVNTDYGDFFSNLTFFVGNIDPVLINTTKVKNREKIESNLQEIIEILVDDLSNINKSDYKEVNELVRIIDKVNYIRGQY